MKELLDEHFDKLLLFVVFVITIVVYWFRPDGSEWVSTVLGAVIMVLTGKRIINSNGTNGGTK
jgi:Na+/H+ antiporter NhaD/arsenite permease-like protein